MKLIRIIKVCSIIATLVITSCVRDYEKSLDGCYVDIDIKLKWVDTAPLDSDLNNKSVDVTIDPDDSKFETVGLKSNPVGVTVAQKIIPGFHLMTAWEAADNVVVEGKMVSAAYDQVGDIRYLKEPSKFSGGYAENEVKFSKVVQSHTIPLYQQTRQLNVILKVIGDGMDIISGVDVKIDGVTISRDLEYGFKPVNGLNNNPSEMSGVMYFDTFKLNSTESTADKKVFEDSRILLGLNGESTHSVEIEIFNNMGYDSSIITESVTDKLFDFHTDRVELPYEITITLDVGSNLDMQILDWEAGPVTDYVAE